ncbi:hypothetical protein SAMN05216334_13514 [Nitrosomonas ureae]|uniref:Uncharacterized protein n=1 Tax=Nitrosomonas ureae TaxID=44577 RepID=A0A1H5Y130_9PROT|nr:hypothetical protein SAMN05216334_13514 [Nitrosomonas ureae]
MGSPNGLISTEQSVTGMRWIIRSWKFEDSDKFFASDGQMVGIDRFSLDINQAIHYLLSREVTKIT